ncbi:MAG: polysaccharide deacetylase family protein [Microthrixaceae bacterium]
MTVLANLAAVGALVGVTIVGLRLGDEPKSASAPRLEPQSAERGTSRRVQQLGEELRNSTSGTHPIVLSYHDVQPLESIRGDSSYPVAAHEFADQMAVLRAAGYQSIGVDDFLAYLDGEPVPDRSVMITFDDNPNGLWTQADKILEREGLRGVVYVITSSVDTSSYYLDWNEIREMYDSGRWEFQSHSDDLHQRRPLTPDGPDVAPLANPLWLTDSDRPETLEEWRTRVHDDLERSIRALSRHDLPRPELFAYPFSELATEDGARPTVPVDAVSGLLNDFFSASMINDPEATPVLPDDPRSEIPRIEVLRTTTLDEFVTTLRSAQPDPDAAPRPLTKPGLWSQGSLDPDVVAFEDDTVALDPDVGGFAQIDLAKRLPEWADHDFAVTVDGLSRPKVTDGTHTVEASVRVHAGSADQITIEVEYGDLAVYHDGDLQFRRNLGTASSIRVAARPSSGSTSILVNDKPVGSVDTAPHPPGGVALTMRRGDKATQPAPVFSGLTIGRSADGAGQDGS